jgi:MinD-like ATPase involved in chromosome partitioning or flagellar assembly
MGTIAFASAKSSPGVTTTVAALAAAWPADRDVFVAELDPAGGDLVIRFDLAAEPGLVSLAAAGRRDLRPETVVAHTQALPFDRPEGGRRRMLVAPVAAEQSAAALATLRTGLLPVLGALGGDVLIDCGRLDPGSPVTDVAAGADLLVVVVRPVLSEVHHLAARLAGLKPRALSLVTVGDQPYPVTEVATAVGATALGTMPIDPRSAQALASAGAGTSKGLRRSPLIRDARAVAEGLAAWLGPQATTGDPAWTAPTTPPEAGYTPGAAAPGPGPGGHPKQAPPQVETRPSGPHPPPPSWGETGAASSPAAPRPTAPPPPPGADTGSESRPAAPRPPAPPPPAPGNPGVEAAPGSPPPVPPPPPTGLGADTAPAAASTPAARDVGAEATASAVAGPGPNGHEREPKHFRRSGGEARR